MISRIIQVLNSIFEKYGLLLPDKVLEICLKKDDSMTLSQAIEQEKQKNSMDENQCVE